jgi:glycerophosphoryl diester phosphodiesterase
MRILSHRGIDLERETVCPENSLAAFRWCAEKGLGLELDLQLTADHVLIVAHDATLERWSEGTVKRAWATFKDSDLLRLEAAFSPLARFTQVLTLAHDFPNLHLAIHVKGTNQTSQFMLKLVEVLKEHASLFPRILLFDLKRETVLGLKQALPGIGLAASVADDYDIVRFQNMTNGTLLTVTEFLAKKTLYTWAWLDEWDRVSLTEPAKALYTSELVDRLHKNGVKVAMISPELHKIEGHQDAESLKTLNRRWREMLSLKPEAICTDYPARLSALLKS